MAKDDFGNRMKGLDGKQLTDKLFMEKGINWNELPVWQKRGVCITKQPYFKGEVQRSKWDVDPDTPIFSQQRDYLNQYVYHAHKGEPSSWNASS